MKTLAYGNIGHCVLFVAGKHPLDDREWDGYVQFLGETLVPGSNPVCLVLTEGAGPTATQRQRLNEVIAPVFREFKTAVITSSHIARGILTAMSWIYPVYHVFSPGEIDAALRFLGIEGPRR